MSVDQIEEICRLCSSKENLVSMFHGKSRNTRDILRKLIYDAVNIDIGLNDNLPKSVCLNCCIDVYNFYIFRQECIQNENVLKTLELDVSTKPKKQKLNHVDLSHFKLPDQEYIKNTVATWLTQKQSDIRDISVTSENAEEKSQIRPEVIHIAVQTEHMAKSECHSIQTDQISVKEKGVQVDIKKKSSKKATQTSVKTEEIGNQTNNIKSYLDKSTEISERSPEEVKQTLYNDMYIQTESPYLADKYVQALIKTKTSRKFSQTLPVKIINIPSESGNVVTDKESFEKKSNDIDIHVQTEPLNVDDKKIQCDFTKYIKNNFDLKRNKIESVIRSLGKTDTINDKSTQCELIDNTKISTVTDAKATQTSSFFSTRRRHTQTEDILSMSLPEKTSDYQFEKKNITNYIESFCQTDSVIEDKLEYNCSCLQKDDLESLDKITQTSITFNRNTDNIMTTMSDESIQCELISYKSDAKTLLKMDFKEEFVSPSSSLHINTDSSFDSQHFTSPKTPTTSDLLKVRDRSEVVKHCKICDKTLYNEREQRLHRKTHMQCKLCKKHFRSFKKTEEHLKLCKLKSETMLYVQLVKIDKTPQHQHLYNKAFHDLEETNLDDTRFESIA